MDLIERAKENHNRAYRFNWTALVLFDQQSAQTQRLTAVESQDEAMVGVIRRHQHQVQQGAKALVLQPNQGVSEPTSVDLSPALSHD